jgi:RNA polymerase sigma factor (sigma-70 family)
MAAVTSSLADDMLLRAYAARGDAGAFAELVRRYAGMVYATARRVTGNPAVAEDVSQDCFLRLAQKSAAVSGSVAAWLHRTCVNRSLEVIRAERARKQREAAAVKPAADDAGELIASVDEALTTLPDDLRVILTEHFLCNRTQMELAAMMGVSQSTVSRRIDDGVERVRSKLREDGWAAPIAIPILLHEAARQAATAPAALSGALTKIGLSGIGAGVATGKAAGAAVANDAVAAMLAKIAVVIGLLLSITAGGLLIRSYFLPPPFRQVVVPSAATTTQASAEADDHDDHDDKDDTDVVSPKSAKPNLQP